MIINSLLTYPTRSSPGDLLARRLDTRLRREGVRVRLTLRQLVIVVEGDTIAVPNGNLVPR